PPSSSCSMPWAIRRGKSRTSAGLARLGRWTPRGQATCPRWAPDHRRLLANSTSSEYRSDDEASWIGSIHEASSSIRSAACARLLRGRDFLRGGDNRWTGHDGAGRGLAGAAVSAALLDPVYEIRGTAVRRTGGAIRNETIPAHAPEDGVVLQDGRVRA